MYARKRPLPLCVYSGGWEPRPGAKIQQSITTSRPSVWHNTASYAITVIKTWVGFILCPTPTVQYTGGYGDILGFFMYVLYSTLLHLPPPRFHCVEGCWDQTQDSCDFSIGCQTLASRLHLIRSSWASHKTSYQRKFYDSPFYKKPSEHKMTSRTNENPEFSVRA